MKLTNRERKKLIELLKKVQAEYCYLTIKSKNSIIDDGVIEIINACDKIIEQYYFDDKELN